MSNPADNRKIAGVIRPTAFRPGQSGNPAGRRPGTRNRTTVEVREVATKLVDDPEYREQLRRRMIAGTAGPIELLMWHYSRGKPIERVETGAPNAFAELSDAELKSRLEAALRALA